MLVHPASATTGPLYEETGQSLEDCTAIAAFPPSGAIQACAITKDRLRPPPEASNKHGKGPSGQVLGHQRWGGGGVQDQRAGRAV
jgi:hypothetical protein